MVTEEILFFIIIVIAIIPGFDCLLPFDVLEYILISLLISGPISVLMIVLLRVFNISLIPTLIWGITYILWLLFWISVVVFFGAIIVSVHQVIEEFSAKKDWNHYADPQDNQQYLKIYLEKLKSKVSLSVNIIQCMTVGPPNVGKTTLKQELLGQTPEDQDKQRRPCSSPVVDDVDKIRVTVTLDDERVKQFSSTVLTNERECSWKVLSLDDEIIGWLKKLCLNNKRNTERCSLKKYFFPVVLFLVLVFIYNFFFKSISTSISFNNYIELFHYLLISVFVLTLSFFLLLIFFGNILTYYRKRKSSATSPELVVAEALEHNNIRDIQPFADENLILYFRDCGGQPEFHEVLPALVSYTTLFLLMFNLNEDFNKPYDVTYKASERETSNPYKSTFTVKESLFQSLASIRSIRNYSKTSKSHFLKWLSGFLNWMSWLSGLYNYKFWTKRLLFNTVSRVIVIGTHKDKLLKRKSLKEAYHKIHKISDTLREEFSSMMFVRNSSDDDQQEKLLLGICTHNTDDIKLVKEIINKQIQKGNYKIDIPVPWLALELCIRKNLKGKVTSLNVCRRLAFECEIRGTQEFKAALWFLHHIVGTIRYFRDVPKMQDVVITDPQILFDIVTYLIVESFSFVKDRTPREESRFKNSGRFTEDFLNKCKAVKDKLLTTQQIISLLQYLIIIAPVGINRDGQKEYFLPCVLVHAEEPDAEQKQNLYKISPPPLLITFECCYVPRGIFSCLIAHMLSSSNGEWELMERIYRNQACFHHESGYRVSIRNYFQFCEVVATPPKNSPKSFTCHLPSIVKNLNTCLKYVEKRLNYTSAADHSFSFYCQCWNNDEHEDHPHIAKVVRQNHTICYMSKETIMLTPGQYLWFGVKVESSLCLASALTPDTDDVCILLGQISYDWDNIALHLGVPFGFRQGLRKIEGSDNNERLAAVVNKWDQSRSSDVSWEKLIDALEKAGHKKTADEVEQYLINNPIAKRKYNFTVHRLIKPNSNTSKTSTLPDNRHALSTFSKESVIFVCGILFAIILYYAVKQFF